MSIVAGLFWFILFCVVARRMASGRRIERHMLRPTYQAEVARLREEVDQLTAQVMRLTDEQQFMVRLLADGQTEGEPALLSQPKPENS